MCDKSDVLGNTATLTLKIIVVKLGLLCSMLSKILLSNSSEIQHCISNISSHDKFTIIV